MRKSFFKFIYTGVTAFSLLSGCSLYNISELRSASSASTDEYSEDDDNKIVSPAIPIAGTYLTYENAAINCNFEEKGDNKFKVICQAMAELKNGTQIVPTAKVASLNLNWSAPKFNNSSLIESYECSLSNNKLVNECEINTVSKTDIHIKYDLQVIEGQENRNISAKVLLPYALSLVGGLVTTMRVIGDVKDSHALSIPKLPAKSTEVFSDSVCRSASGVYFTHADHVFRIEVRNGKFDENFSVYAGSHNRNEMCGYNTSANKCTRQDLVLSPKMNLHCSEKGLYIADVQNKRILFVPEDIESVAQKVSHVLDISNDSCLPAGSPVQRMVPITPISTDAQGNLYVADTCANKIIKVSSDKEKIVTTLASIKIPLAGVELPTDISIASLHNLTLASNGELVFVHSDRGIYRFNLVEGKVRLVGKLPDVLYRNPDNTSGFAVSLNPVDGSIIIADVLSNRIYKLNADDTLIHYAGAHQNDENNFFVEGETDADKFKFYGLKNLDVDAFGNVFVADYFNKMIHVIDINKKVQTIAGAFRAHGKEGAAKHAYLHSVFGMAYSNSGELFLTTTSKHRVKKITNEGNVETAAGNPGYWRTHVEKGETDNLAIGDAQSIKLHNPFGLAFDSQGRLLIAEEKGLKIRALKDGVVTTLLHLHTVEPQHMTIDADDNIYITNAYGQLVKYSAPNLARTNLRSSMLALQGLAVDKAANVMYLSELGKQRIHRINLSNPGLPASWSILTDALTASAGTETVNYPGALTVTSDGTIYVVDRINGNNKIKKIKINPDTQNTEVTNVFENELNENCGVGYRSGELVANNYDDLLKASLGAICRGEILSITSKDNCVQDPSGTITLTFAQKFKANYSSQIGWQSEDEYGSNIITVTRKCH